MVPPASHGIPRVPRYSGSSHTHAAFAYGALTLYCRPSHTVLLALLVKRLSTTPEILLLLDWPTPRSLATTCGISFDFFSSSYLDVSVQTVPHVRLFCSTHADRVLLCLVSPFGNSGIKAYEMCIRDSYNRNNSCLLSYYEFPQKSTPSFFFSKSHKKRAHFLCKNADRKSVV